MPAYRFTDPDIGDITEISLPVSLNLDLEEARNDLNIPEYVAIENFAMRKTLAVLWVSRTLNSRGTDFEGAGRSPIPISLFGGIAFRFHCPSMNDPDNALHRTPNDVDYAILQEDGKRFTTILQQLGRRFGSALSHWTFRRDRVFNGFRGGSRYRFRCVAGVEQDGTPIPGITDIVCDNLSFCHEVPLRNAIGVAHNNQFTIGLERMILSKAQFIRRVPVAQLTEDVKPRLLDSFGPSEVLIGMEPKDMKDVSAAFLDHELGDGVEKIDISIIGKMLEADWGLRKTVLLNLTNLNRALKNDFLGLGPENSRLVRDRVQTIVEAINEKYIAKKPRFNFSSEWWEAVDEGRA